MARNLKQFPTSGKDNGEFRSDPEPARRTDVPVIPLSQVTDPAIRHAVEVMRAYRALYGPDTTIILDEEGTAIYLDGDVTPPITTQED
jgi:hypothetical protein